MEIADLHTHTTFSDGVLTPHELLEKAVAAGLKAISITDHDTVDAHKDAVNYAGDYDIELISGCEISCYDNGKEFHILGYGVDIYDENLNNFTKQFKKVRLERAKKMHSKLSNLGIQFDFDLILDKADEASISRPHIAQVLVDLEHVQNLKAAFNLYLRDHGPAYYPKDTFPVAQAIELINNAGGIAVLAHPANFVTQAELYQMIRSGLDGIEIVHPSHRESHRKFYQSVANQYWLIGTGGSDYHGNKDWDEINFGKSVIDYKIVNSIKKQAAQR